MTNTEEPDREALGQLTASRVDAIRLVVACYRRPADGAEEEIEVLTPEQAGSSGWLMRWLDGPDGWAYQAETEADQLPGAPQVEAIDAQTVILRPAR